ncbi:aspartate/glutamate racemase family protein [Sinorhizobium meliloti]|uniref:aspartate/glutamate racemase family protein n=1 Tax=Rhizobium meliloti TaxID=382 RepID=UPI00398A4DBF
MINTTSAMTELMGDTARTVAAAGRDIVLTTSRSGAASIEGHYDEALSNLGVIDEIAQGEPADAYIIGCFGDPGMSNLMERLSHRLAVPDIDGVAAAVKFAEGIVGMGLRTSKVGDLAYPLPKAYAGKLPEYAPASLKLRKKYETSTLATAIGG